METAVLLDPVELKDSTGTTINPVQDETVILLRKIVKLLEASTVVDSQQRQRVAVDSITAASGGTSLGVAVTNGGNTPVATPPVGAGTIYAQGVWEMPVDQRWRIAENARMVFATSIRSNLVWSA